MADVNRGNRPLSPHLSIYRPQITMITSITHRITGVGLAASAVLIVWWFLAASTGPEYFAVADAVLTSWYGATVLIISLWALSYHLCNGIRHLFWDVEMGLEMATANRSGIAVFVGSIVLTVLTLIVT